MTKVAVRRTGLGLAAVFAAGLLGMSSPRAATPSSFDGVYSGDVAAGTPKNPRDRCLDSFPNTRLRVTNGVASISWNGPLSGPVGTDGSLSITGSNGGGVAGSFSATGFSGTLSGGRCIFKADLKKN